MKNIIFIFSFFAILNCKAQSPIISTVEFENSDDIELTDGCYLKDVENKFTPFLGTWKWENGNNLLEVVFTKVEMVFNGDYYEDKIIGKYKYIENGVEVINYLDLNNDSMFLITGSGYYTDTTHGFIIVDKQKNLYCKLLFNLVSPTQAEWKVKRADGGRQPSGFTFPTEVTLTKH